MVSITAGLLAVLVPLALGQGIPEETVLGVYIFHRHGDRTAKSTPPANLTDLGYREVFISGQYFRSRYIDHNAPQQIQGISPEIVADSQIAASAPADTVLQNSVTGFLQGLYPPIGNDLAVSTLRNGSQVTAPLEGYQLIPVSLASSGGGSEVNTWLHSASGCANAVISSNSYFSSSQYATLLQHTYSFYQDISPVVNGTFPPNSTTYKNAYSIFDLINVAEIHNMTINSSDLLTNDVLFQLRILANAHEWALAYNQSDTIRAISGMTLAAQVVQFLNSTSSSHKAPKFGVQFGSYGTFASFFGLANLTSTDPDFYGIADYASAMVFELFTNTSRSDDLYVRFLFHNGTTSNSSQPTAYPLFGSGQEVLSWQDFADGMNRFAVGSTKQWCQACGNTTGSCASYQRSGSGSNSAPAKSIVRGSSNGLSPAVNGVIGACVTLAAVLGTLGVLMLAGGYRFVKADSMLHGRTGSADAHGAPMEVKARQ